LTGIVTLIAALGVVAFGGKAAQAFSEPSTLVSQVTTAVTTAVKPNRGPDPNIVMYNKINN
jgi:hypothetical protein